MSDLDDKDKIQALELIVKIFAFPIVFLLLFFVALPFSLLEAWGLWLTYGWFLQPLGLPELSYWHLFGITIFVDILALGYRRKDDRKPKEVVQAAFTKAGVILLLVGAAYIVQGWI